jgi:hypothetical protein
MERERGGEGGMGRGTAGHGAGGRGATGGGREEGREERTKKIRLLIPCWKVIHSIRANPRRVAI